MEKDLLDGFSATIIIQGKTGRQITIKLRKTNSLEFAKEDREILLVTKDVQFFSGMLDYVDLDKDLVSLDNLGNYITGKISEVLGWAYSDEAKDITDSNDN